MVDNDRHDLTIAANGTPRRRRWRTFLLAGAACAVLALLLGFLFRDRLLNFWRGDEDQGTRFPPGVLADYVPEDSEAVLAVDVRSLLQSPLGRQYLGPPLRQFIGQAEQQLPWVDLLGVKPLDDLDTLLVSFAPGAGGEPLCLARGRLDRSRIRAEPDKLSPKTIDHFRAWEYTDRRTKQTTLLVPLGDMLVISQTRNRVLAALKQASDPQPIHVRDAVLRELLAKVDRRQNLWLAASIKKLGPINGIDNYLLKMVLRPLLAHADSVYGGITCAEDLRVELHFHTATDDDAVRLEADLRSICETAPSAALLLGRQKELLPLLRLLGACQISRDDKMILLRCRLTADQLDG